MSLIQAHRRIEDNRRRMKAAGLRPRSINKLCSRARWQAGYAFLAECRTEALANRKPTWADMEWN